MAYPNPTSGELFLEFEGFTEEEAGLIIYNVLGERVLNRVIPLGSKKYTFGLDAEGLSSGSYWISIRTDKTVITRKAVLSRT